jgi:hypothetical protein
MIYNYRNDPVLGVVLAYWDQKRGTRLMPCKRDIDPIEIPRRLLPNLQLIDVIDGGERFRYRLVGTASVDAYGSDYTGKYPEEMFSDDRPQRIKRIYRTVCETKAPLFCQNKYLTPKNIELQALRIYMPLSDDDGDDVQVSHIFGVLRFEFGSRFDRGIWGKGTISDPTSHYVEPITIC